MKIRKRSDVKYNIFSEDKALSSNKKRKPIETIEMIKHKLDAENNSQNSLNFEN